MKKISAICSGLHRVDEGRVDPASQDIYMINCLSALEHVVARHACCAARCQQLNDQISSQLSALVSSQAGSLLGKAGLAEIADRIRCIRFSSCLISPSSPFPGQFTGACILLSISQHGYPVGMPAYEGMVFAGCTRAESLAGKKAWQVIRH